MPDAMQTAELAGYGGIFTVFFIMLGPLKLIGPFAQGTREMEPAISRRVAILAFSISLVAVALGGLLGRLLLVKWHISAPLMTLAGGIIFLLVGMRVVLEPYAAEHVALAALPEAPVAAAMRVAFPSIVTPYGVAVLIVLLANSHDASRFAGIFAVLALVMVLNLLAMLFARQLLGPTTAIVLSILGAVLGVLQVGLALELILRALEAIGLLRI